MQDPQSLHKYLYVHGDPVNGFDPTGLMSLGGTLAGISISSGLIAVGVNGISNYANGRNFFENASNAYLFGAIAGPLAYLFPALGAGMSLWFTISSIAQAYHVVGNTESTIGQKIAAISVVGLALFGNYAATRNVRVNGFWYNQNVFVTAAPPLAPADTISVTPRANTGQPQAPVRSVPRLPQDQSVNPTPPAALPPTGRTVSGNAAQNLAAGRFIAALIRMGARDIRVDQQQVNASGVRVGTNRPDTQFTWQGLRYYIEWDTASSSRGVPHAERIMSNDPNGVTLIWTLE